MAKGLEESMEIQFLSFSVSAIGTISAQAFGHWEGSDVLVQSKSLLPKFLQQIFYDRVI